ncbi:MAG: MATE family efflux transporter [Cereibacter sphaeroides]|uniref:Multidrug-efflux transporter n=1 Tax=Cereibacter sphaeroides TaxID=1063 RepID=A0A2W5S7F7_CERSP|nr:MAG: MATE family efflux transporter [Cereibacter sphaeroides]
MTTLVAQTRAEALPLVRLAVPIICGYSASMLPGITDSLMLAPLGPVPLAAVGLTYSTSGVIFASVWGLLTVMGVRIGAAWGAGEGRRIPFMLRNGLVLGVVAGLLGALAMAVMWLFLPYLGQPDEVLAALPFYWACIALYMIPFAVLTVFSSAFEAVNRPWLGTAFAFLAVGLNVPLNYWLIWGGLGVPPLGLMGAGIASLTAEVLALAAAWTFWMRARSMRRLRLRRRLSWAEIVSALREGAPLGFLYAAESGAMAVGTLIIGTFGTIALAANQVVSSVGGLLYMVPLGFAGAVALRIAQETGAGNHDRLRPTALAALAISCGWLSIAVLVLMFGGGMIAGAISDDPAVVALATQLFLAIAAMQLSDGVQSTMLGALRGLSDTAWPAMVSIVAYWGVALPLGYFFAWPMGVGPVAIWLGFALGLSIAGVALTLRFRWQTE